ncbi:MAG: DNA alkylation repair protein [Bacteroidales bacterium]|jgi:3-methyladenine DNA glycosylase AlkD
MTATAVQEALTGLASADKQQQLQRYFKTGPGQYGEGDVFIGVTVPQLRAVAKQYKALPFSELKLLITSPVHEERSAALFILENKNKKATTGERRQILSFYLEHLPYVNNWDLVDLTCRDLLGRAMADGLAESDLLDSLACSDSLWERRIAIVATWYFISKGQLDHTLRIARMLLADKEDLIHKAIGWMLREGWKKDPATIEQFLQTHYDQLPRTTLRYAIERMDEPKRRAYLDRI